MKLQNYAKLQHPLSEHLTNLVELRLSVEYQHRLHLGLRSQLALVPHHLVRWLLDCALCQNLKHGDYHPVLMISLERIVKSF